MKSAMVQVISVLLITFPPVTALAQQVSSFDERAKTVDELMAEFSGVTYFWQQQKAMEGLVASGDPEVIPRMERYLDAEDRAWRCNAAWVIASLGDARGLTLLIEELSDQAVRPTDMIGSDGKPWPERQISQDRYYAALLLGKLGSREAVPALIKATKDSGKNRGVRTRAASSLAEIGDKRAIPALRMMARDFPKDRLWAGYALAALEDPEGIDILTGVITREPDWQTRRRAVSFLKKIATPKAISIMVKALEDQHPNVAIEAVNALAEVGDASAIPALTEALRRTQSPEVFTTPTTVGEEARKAIEAIKMRMIDTNRSHSPVSFERSRLANPAIPAFGSAVTGNRI